MTDGSEKLRVECNAQMERPAMQEYSEDRAVLKRVGKLLAEASARAKDLLRPVPELWR